MRSILLRFASASLLVWAMLVVGSAEGATFVVDSAGDASDNSAGDGNCATAPPMPACTLRAAIEEVNALGGADTIQFGIGSGAVTITLGSPLPAIVTVVTIDGTTQPGFAGSPLVEIDATSGGASTLSLNGAGSSGSTIRGLVINRSPGTAIQLFGSSNNVVAENFLGTNAAGTAALGNQVGVSIGGSALATDNNLIGGTTGADRNLISGNTADGIQIDGGSGGAANNLVQGNYIGTNAAGTGAVGNTGSGIRLDNLASNNTIGGTAAGAGNVIAYNGQKGVRLTATAGTGNAILGNSIHSNTGLGIDLVDDGITLNDLGDSDVGPNNLQNYPVLSVAVAMGGKVHIAGSLNSAASTTYRVEFFASTAAVGTDEGQRFLGFKDVTTDGNGNAVFGVGFTASVLTSENITATATDPSNNTSEFSDEVKALGTAVVTTTADVADGDTSTITALIGNPGADGRISLREAFLAANTTGGTDTIRFAIPLADANHIYYRDDSNAGTLSILQVTALADADITDFDPDHPSPRFSWYRIRPTSALPTISGAVILEGYTQVGAQANSVAAPGISNAILKIELDGTLAGSSHGLTLTAGSSTIRGLVINRFTQNGIDVSSGGSNTIAGNYSGTDVTGTIDHGNGSKGFEIWSANNTLGGTTPGARNLISGNAVGVQLRGAGATGNLVLGNFIGTSWTGAADLGNSEDGVRFANGASSNTIGGTTAGARNVISGNDAQGIVLWGAANANNVLQGNYIGLNAAGNAAIPNLWGGVGIDGTNTTLGGSAAGEGNVISGNTGSGVEVYSSGHTIQGNFIGTDALGTASVPNTTNGVDVGAASNLRIGGSVAGAGNKIAFNQALGIILEAAAGTGNTILGNSIHSNGGIGIDLNADGVTANDVGDGDGGPNNLLNFPFITSVQHSGGSLTVYYKLDVPAGSYRVEFFDNQAADGSGNGEGEALVAFQNVTHGGGGSQDFTHSFAGAEGDIITATATFCTDAPTCASFSDTSEFSNAFTAVPTAVKLESFTAQGEDHAIELSWRTSSELSNLGFHLYSSLSSSGPYERITEELIAGLGSSPVGTSYRYRDSGLENGVTYFYKLEDIETTGRRELHGPVWATPEEGDGSDPVAHGDPSKVTLRILEWGPRGALLELLTGGFYATALSDGTYQLEVPGFEEVGWEGRPAIPVKRTWLEAVAGRGARITSTRAFDEKKLPGLRPSSASTVEIVARPEGTVSTRRTRGRGAPQEAGLHPPRAARVVETGFQGDVKKALVELAPLRWDEGAGRLLWTKRLLVRVSFEGVEATERSLGGSRGRRYRTVGTSGRRVLARLSTSKPGLYRARFEEILGPGGRPVPAESLRLSRLGGSVSFHLEPSGASFGPGSTMYFVSEGEASNPYGNEAVYELEWASGGKRMSVGSAAPAGASIGTYRSRIEREENRYYQAGLLEAPSLWLWDVLLTRSSKRYSFTVSEAMEAPGRLEVWFQGASDFDHRVKVFVNETQVGEASFPGKKAESLEIDVPSGILREGQNELGLENAGDTYSMVFLDRFAVTYARRPVAEGGALQGRFEKSGTVSVGGLGPGSLVLQASAEPTWIEGAISTPSGVSFYVEEGASYLAVSPNAVYTPRIRRASATHLRSGSKQADYLLIGPRELLPAAEPLLSRRRLQGLVSRAVAVEDIYDEFGYGEARPEAVRDFLAYAYHSWKDPSFRYVLLLGDATYDGKDYLGTGVVNRVPPLMRRTTYLWTVSDPGYASVNGDDVLPDVALGRLPAASIAEARLLVQKLLAYEDSRQGLGGRVVLIADNPDAAGDFERNAEEIAAELEGREVRRIFLRELGAPEAREAVRGSLDEGASLLSYVGHGGIAIWASENLFAGSDVRRLARQPQQPIAMTMNCLNGYFHFPYFDSLGEALVKAEGKGAIAALSPSGLSLNAPAHFYHQALVEELASGRHARLGDALLSAQKRYADSGLFPELLAIYHLFGDPALSLR